MPTNSRYEAKRGQRLQDTKMIQWRERIEVFREAERIAERDHLKNQEAFSKLLRNAIALYDTMGQVKEHLKGKRKGGVMYALYDPSPFDVITFIEEACSERTQSQVIPTSPAEQDADAPTTKTIQWRESPSVIDEAVRIASVEGTNNKEAFSMLLCNGIALDGTIQCVRQHIYEQRQHTIEAMENSPLAWERRQAKSQRLLYTLYEPSDLEVIQFIQETIQMKIGEAAATTSEPKPSTVEIDLGTSTLNGDDMVSIRLANHIVNLGTGADGADIEGIAGSQSFDIPAEQVDGRDAFEMTIQGRVMRSIRIGEALSCYKSVLSAETGEYDTLSLTDSYDGTTPPTAVILRVGDKEIRIDSKDGMAYHGQADGGKETEETHVLYGHYAVRVDNQNDDLSVMLR